MTSSELGYRKDIEGLRAVAILLVILAHAGVSWFEGGFIGVDIFFVMSGYLITGLLLKEVQGTGSINFLMFYVARLKRLLPALLFMVLVTSILAMLYLSPFEHEKQASSAGYASIWLSNMYFAFEKLDYFAAGADENMYLHTWSLGVEEQFYLLWPILVLSAVGGWKWQHGSLNLRRLLFFMVCVVVICLGASIYLSNAKPALGFYLMPSRAWQFALGALALLWPVCLGYNVVGISNVELRLKVRKWLHLGGWVGFVSVVLASLFIHSDMTYPSYWAVIPSLGAALVLVAGAMSGGSLLSRCLSVKPLLWIGRISYSWYLWHWSILVLGAKITQHNDVVNNWVWILASLLLAIFSYFVVESPIRNSKYLARKPLLTLVVALILMGASYGLVSGWKELAKGWVTLPGQSIFAKIASDLPITYSMNCDDWYHSATLKHCMFGNKDAKHTAVLIGDSIGAQWSPALARRYVGNNWRFIVLTKSSCAMIDEPYFYRRIGREYTECSIWRDAAVKWLKVSKPDVVFMGSATARFKKEQWISGTERILQQLAPVVNDIYIIRATPSLYIDGPACLSQQDWQLEMLPEWLRVSSSCSSVFNNPHAEEVYEWLQVAAEKFENAHVINMSPVVCPDNQCSAVQNGRAVYRDSMHLSKSYVWSVAGQFFEKVDNR